MTVKLDEEDFDLPGDGNDVVKLELESELTTEKQDNTRLR